jgi:hypothetical protein
VLSRGRAHRAAVSKDVADIVAEGGKGQTVGVFSHSRVIKRRATKLLAAKLIARGCLVVARVCSAASFLVDAARNLPQ